METRIRNFERGLDAGDATANYQRSRMDRDMQRLERFVVIRRARRRLK